MRERKVVSEVVEKEIVNAIVGLAVEHGLTINNIKETVEEACNYMERNATLKRDYQGCVGSLKEINRNGIDTVRPHEQ